MMRVVITNRPKKFKDYGVYTLKKFLKLKDSVLINIGYLKIDVPLSKGERKAVNRLAERNLINIVKKFPKSSTLLREIHVRMSDGSMGEIKPRTIGNDLDGDFAVHQSPFGGFAILVPRPVRSKPPVSVFKSRSELANHVASKLPHTVSQCQRNALIYQICQVLSEEETVELAVNTDAQTELLNKFC